MWQIYGLLLPIFLEFWILFWTRLTGITAQASKWAPGCRFHRTCQLDSNLELYVYLCLGWECLPVWIDQWQPAKPSRQRSLPRWNKPSDGGVGIAAVLWDMRVFAMCRRRRECLCSADTGAADVSILTEFPTRSAHPEAPIQWTHLTFSYSCPLWLTQHNLLLQSPLSNNNMSSVQLIYYAAIISKTRQKDWETKKCVAAGGSVL